MLCLLRVLSSRCAMLPVLQDARIIQKLHRRIFLDKITRDEVTLYMSFYVEAANRDAFMAGACGGPWGTGHAGEGLGVRWE